MTKLSNALYEGCTADTGPEPAMHWKDHLTLSGHLLVHLMQVGSRTRAKSCVLGEVHQSTVYRALQSFNHVVSCNKQRQLMLGLKKTRHYGLSCEWRLSECRWGSYRGKGSVVMTQNYRVGCETCTASGLTLCAALDECKLWIRSWGVALLSCFVSWKMFRECSENVRNRLRLGCWNITGIAPG